MKRIALGCAVALALGAGVAVSATPFGGDNSGFIPPDSPKGPITKCETGVGKAVGKFVTAILKCHASRVTGKLVDETAEEACEATAVGKFGLVKTDGCKPCTNIGPTGLAATVHALVDLNNDKAYCDNTGTPWGGTEDNGFIPPDAPGGPIAKCENGVGKSIGKLVGAIIKCHANRAINKLTDHTGEEACEIEALGKFGLTKTDGCSACTNLGSVGAFVEATVDASNILVFCASPSGAFLD